MPDVCRSVLLWSLASACAHPASKADGADADADTPRMGAPRRLASLIAAADREHASASSRVSPVESPSNPSESRDRLGVVMAVAFLPPTRGGHNGRNGRRVAILAAHEEGTVCLWHLGDRRACDEPTNERIDEPLWRQRAHGDAATCLAADERGDGFVSGGADGAVLLHTLRQGRHLRTLRDAGSDAGVPSWLCFLEAPVAAVLVYDGDQLTLSTHGINSPSDAPPLATANATERLHALTLSPDGRFLVTGGEKGAVVVRNCHDLRVCARYDGPGPAVTALRTTTEECIVGGLADGRIAVWAPGVAGA